MRAANMQPPHSRVKDDLDVAAAMAELGIGTDALDDALATLEREDTGLDSVWKVPEELEDRIAQGVQRRLRDQETAWLVAELMGLTWNTMRTLIEPGKDLHRDR